MYPAVEPPPTGDVNYPPNIGTYCGGIISFQPIVVDANPANPANSSTTMSKLIPAVAIASLLWVGSSAPISKKVSPCINPTRYRELQSSSTAYSFTRWRSTQALA